MSQTTNSMLLAKNKTDWLKRCRENEKLAERCYVLINQYHEHDGSSETLSVSTSIRAHLKAFKKEYDALKKEFPALKKRNVLSEREVSQFQQILDKQLTLLRQMEDGFSSSGRVVVDDRRELLGANVDVVSASPWVAGTENETTQQWGTRELHMQHDAIIVEQDRGLDQLSKSVRRQRDVALNIGAEVDYQNEVLGNITHGVEATRERVQQANRNVLRVEVQTGGTCCLWTVIVVLAVMIVVAGALPKRLIFPV